MSDLQRRKRGGELYLRVLERDLAAALRNGELVLHYQPIVSMGLQHGDESVAGFEALVRWLHPRRGLIPPNSFIPIAEQSDLIIGLGRWIVRSAIAGLAHLDANRPRRKHPAKPLFMTINVSGRQFSDPELVHVLVEALAAHRIDPARIHLEITESSLLDRMDQAVQLMERCTDLGVRLSVDDFGTGYSALSYLYRLPVTAVKLARPFIHDLETYPSAVKIVGAVSRLARELKLDLIAEGIETRAHAARVRALGIGLGQGFHYAAGMPLAVAVPFVPNASAALPLTAT